MNPDRWHQARSTYPPRTTPKLSGSMKCVGRCGATISGNAKPPLCRACKLLFDAQVLVDTARVEAQRAAAEGTPASDTSQVETEAGGGGGGPQSTWRDGLK